uniref:DUF3165 family protein n=1 Tax=Arachnia propionica TaxID=1750 RepID=UPI0030C6E32A
MSTADLVEYVGEREDMEVRFRMFAAIFLWVLAIICLVLAVVNFMQRPVEAVVGTGMFVVGFLSLLGGLFLSRPARPRSRLR